MLKIDMHAHILPRSWPNLAEKYGDNRFPTLIHQGDRAEIMKDGKHFRTVFPNLWDVETRIAEYAEHDVQVQVVSTVPVMFSYWAPPKQGLEWAQFLNDDVARSQADYPQNIIGLATLPLQDTNLAIHEMERCKNQLNLPGVQIGSHIRPYNLNDPEFFDLFSAAEDLGMAIFVHPWDMMGMDTMDKYWLPWLVSMPAEQSRAICSMIFGGVFERLPGLRVLFAHGGGAFPYTLGRIEHGFRMRPDLCAVDNDVNPREYLGRFFVDSVTHDLKALEYLVDLIGVEHIALGTDYPFPLGEQQPGNLIKELGLEENQTAELFHGAALRWLDLPKERFIQ